MPIWFDSDKGRELSVIDQYRQSPSSDSNISDSAELIATVNQVSLTMIHYRILVKLTIFSHPATVILHRYKPGGSIFPESVDRN